MMFEIFAERLGRGSLAIPQPFDSEVAEALERTALVGTPRVRLTDMKYYDLTWSRGWCVKRNGATRAITSVSRDTVDRLVFHVG